MTLIRNRSPNGLPMVLPTRVKRTERAPPHIDISYMPRMSRKCFLRQIVTTTYRVLQKITSVLFEKVSVLAHWLLWQEGNCKEGQFKLAGIFAPPCTQSNFLSGMILSETLLPDPPPSMALESTAAASSPSPDRPLIFCRLRLGAPSARSAKSSAATSSAAPNALQRQCILVLRFLLD